MNGLVSMTALVRAMIDPEPTQRCVRTPGIGEERGLLRSIASPTNAVSTAVVARGITAKRIAPPM